MLSMGKLRLIRTGSSSLSQPRLGPCLRTGDTLPAHRHPRVSGVPV